jgi:replicative DNA helicase
MATVHRKDQGRQTARQPSQPEISAELLDRLPPQSLEAERGVLGSMLIDPELCDEVALILRADDFYSDAHGKIYHHMVAMRDEGKRLDAMLLVERLKQAGELAAVGGMAYVGELATAVPVPAHAVYYAKIVRDKSTLRSLIHTSTEILRDAWDPTVEPREALNQAEEKIFSVHDRRSNDQVSNIRDVLVETFARIDARLDGSEGAGVPSGFTELDSLTGGLHNSELIILAARPSMGKTALATNILENVAIDLGVPALFISLEMARLELAQRMLCSRGKIDANKFRSGFLSGADHQKLTEVSSNLGESPIFIDDTPSRTVTEVAATARRIKRKHGLGLVVIDYLQLLEPDDPRDPRQEQVAKMARRLKALARELKIPLVCLAQLNRQVEAGREGHRPRLSNLRESGAIEQDADVVMFIHREEYYLKREEAEERGLQGIGEVIIAKQRNGPTGDVKLAWFDKFTRFENLEQRPYDDFD